MLELISVSQVGDQWYINKVVVNPDHITMVTEDSHMNSLLKEGKINLGFSDLVCFSRLTMASKSGFKEIVVAYSPSQIMEKLNRRPGKQLLKG